MWESGATKMVISNVFVRHPDKGFVPKKRQNGPGDFVKESRSATV
jgi:hypothetical protein